MKLKEKIQNLGADEQNQIRPKSSKIYLILPAIIGMVILLFIWQNRDLLQSKLPVSVESAITIKSTGTRSLPENSVIFQAAGWIEADPYATKITPFISGIVEEVHVIDGQSVKKGEFLATLNSEELELELEEQNNALLQSQNRVEIAKARVLEGQADLEHLQTRLATQKSVVETLRNRVDIYSKSKGAISQIDLEQAQLVHKNSISKQKEIANELFQLQAALKLRESEVKLAHSALKGAEVKQKLKALELSRCNIKAPIDGIVMTLKTAPGNSEGPGKELMQLFNPEQLQVRVDVLFADAPALQINQTAEIKLDALPNRKLKGVVTSIVGQADLQRNTIQAKVKILNPDPLLRPDMLARVQFMSVPQQVSDTSKSSSNLTVLIPSNALQNRKSQEAEVWVVSRSSHKTESRKVKLGAPHQDQWIEVIDGVRPGEWVITNPPSEITSNQSVKITQSGRK